MAQSENVDNWLESFKRTLNDSYHVESKAEEKIASQSGNIDENASVLQLNEKISQAQRTADDLIDETTEKFTAFEKKFDDLKNEVSDSKARQIESLGLFVALIAFLSLQIQAFNGVDSRAQTVGLILISAGIMTFFVLILDVMIRAERETSRFIMVRFFLLLAFSIVCAICGAYIFMI